jgi:hypothetical protein
MTAPLRRVRRAVAVVLIASLGGVGAVVATSAAHAAPAAPIISAPIDDTQGFFSVLVEPAPHLLDQTVNVYYRSVATGVDTLGCSVLVPANTPSGDTFPCNVTVPLGAYGFYDLFAIATDVDGDSAPSNTVSSARYGGAADPGSIVLGAPLNGAGDPIDYLSESGAVTVVGQGPALGSVDLRGYPVALGPGAEQYLGGSSVDVTGNFSISATVPTFGIWEVRVLATDIEGTSIDEPLGGATISLRVLPGAPTVGVTSLDGTLELAVSGVAGSTVGAALAIDAFTGGSEVRLCPATWDGTLVNPSSIGPVATCTETNIPPGVHQIDAVQWVDGGAGPFGVTAVYIPGTPTLTVETIPGGAIYSGTIDRQVSALAASGTLITENQIEVLDSIGDVRCFSAVDPVTGNWACTSQEDPGAETFVAVARSFGFGDDPGVAGSLAGYVGGVSDRSAPALVTVPAGSTPPLPTMTYRLGAASIDVEASGEPDSAVSVRLYQVEQVDGEGYTYGDPVDGCGLPDPGVGGGSPNGAPPTAPSFVDNCLFDGLAPGIWNVFSWQSLYFENSGNRDHYVMIPSAPTLTATAAVGDGAVASGQGTPGYRVLVRELGGSAGCSATVGTTGTWSCSVPAVSGQVRLRAQQQSQGFVATPPIGFGSLASFDGYSAFTAPVSVFVPTLPATGDQALTWVLNGIVGGPLAPGQVLDLTADGLPPQTTVVVEIQSTPQVLGSTVADDRGSMALSVTIPLDIESGDHTIVATATPPGGEPSVVSVPVTVEGETLPAAAAPESAQQDGSEGGASSGTGGAGDRSNPAAPSVLTDSIPTVQRIFNDPWVALGSGGLALAILLLVAFPAELLNSTLSRNTGRLGRWMVAFEERAERVTEWFARISRTRAAAAALLVGVTSVIFGFVDPNYGFDPVSARSTVSLAIGLFLITYGAAWITGAIASRIWNVETKVSLEPVALLFAVVGVIVARLLEFSPGFLIGLVIGLDLVSRVDAAVRARVVVLSTGVVASVAVSAWIGYSVLTAVSTGEPGWFELLIHDALVATTAEGLTAALASLLPLGFLAGHDVFRHSKPLWAGTFIVIAALFALIVLPTAQGATASVADMTFWIIVMAVFAAVTLVIWAALHFTSRTGGPGSESPDIAVESGATR